MKVCLLCGKTLMPTDKRKYCSRKCYFGSPAHAKNKSWKIVQDSLPEEEIDGETTEAP